MSVSLCNAGVDPGTSIQEFQALLAERTGVAPEQQELLTGFPPAPLQVQIWKSHARTEGLLYPILLADGEGPHRHPAGLPLQAAAGVVKLGVSHAHQHKLLHYAVTVMHRKAFDSVCSSTTPQHRLGSGAQIAWRPLLVCTLVLASIGRH